MLSSGSADNVDITEAIDSDTDTDESVQLTNFAIESNDSKNEKAAGVSKPMLMSPVLLKTRTPNIVSPNHFM